MFSYIIVDSYYSQNFSINTTTGELSVESALDYEMLPLDSGGQLELTVAAVDQSNPSLNSSSTVVVIVKVKLF